MMMNPLSWIDDELGVLEAKGLRRHPRDHEGPQSVRLHVAGRELINFGSNDYLALAADGRLRQAAIRTIREEGWGSGASPLICGHAAAHQRLAERLAAFEASEAALLFSSGFAANSGTIAALVGPGDVVYCDRKNHASLFDGCRLSRADVRVYPHADCARLASLLAKSQQYRRRLIVTDGLFSMDGDLAPLGDLADLAERHGAMLLVDEAHATGVLGAAGRGAGEHCGVEERIDVRVGTLSKALGSAGGFVAGSRSRIRWLHHRARPYVFSTAGPAAAAAAAMVALDVIRDEPERRRQLLDRSQALRGELLDRGWKVSASVSQIIPLLVGDAGRAVQLSLKLADQGLFVPAIRPPTVPEGEARLRISLTAGHTCAMTTQLVTALGRPSGAFQLL
jgi:8-amino-7-oxononanoate synthase